MKYLYVKNWEKFQHYKDRNPPWIKLHRDLLRDYEFTCLQDASKLLLMLLWLLASQLDNKIPHDLDWLKTQLGINKKPDLKELIKQGFIVVDSNVLADCKRLDIVETETEAETEKPLSDKSNHYADDFLDFWATYPKKTGKGEAYKKWKKEKPKLGDVVHALAWQKESKNWVDGYIPNPATYLNQRRWEDEPEIHQQKIFRQPLEGFM